VKEEIKMYVADVTDIKELRELLAEVEDRLLDDPNNEQALWDREDITERIQELIGITVRISNGTGRG
jgi:hypothetical protein